MRRFEIADPVTGELILIRYWLGGRYLLHRFVKGQDEADGLHDHSWSYWTFPLSPFGYDEEVLQADGSIRVEHVPGWRWSRKPKEHTHRILHPFWSLLYAETDNEPNEQGFYPEG